MNNLITEKVVQTISSREVAEMMQKEHKEIMWMIDGNEKRGIVGIKPIIDQSAELHFADYFIESNYNDRGRQLRCYECTKLGCEMLANKLTGEKGILFTAKYVKRFNEMQQYIEQQVPQISKEDQAVLNIVNAKDKTETALAIKEYKDIITAPLDDEIKKLKPLAEKYGIFLDTEGLTTVEEFSKNVSIKGLGRNNMYEYLRNKNMLIDGRDKRTGRVKDNHNYPKQDAINKGLFKLKPTGSHMSYGHQVTDYKTYITEKGVEKLLTLLIDEGYLNKLA